MSESRMFLFKSLSVTVAVVVLRHVRKKSFYYSYTKDALNFKSNFFKIGKCCGEYMPIHFCFFTA